MKKTIFCIVAFVILVVGFFLPKTGPNVLVDEVFEILIWWLVELYLLCKILIKRDTGTRTQKKARIVIGLVGILLCMWINKNVVADMMTGTEEVVLHDVEVSRYQGYAGIVAVHYYLTGSDEAGNAVRFEVSEDDYYQYMYGGTVRVTYYPKTDRVAGLQ